MLAQKNGDDDFTTELVKESFFSPCGIYKQDYVIVTRFGQIFDIIM
jgi:hypothetical protein